MSWHPYDRKRKLWNVYYTERSNSDPQHAENKVLEFQLTEPYSLSRDDLRDLHIRFLQRITPPEYTLNISQLWTRLWPPDGALRFSKIYDIYKWPVLLSAQMDAQEQPGKREDYFWLLTQISEDFSQLDEVVFLQNIDFENVTWITQRPIEPWPDQLLEYNKAAFAWNRRYLANAEFDQIVARECWGVTVTHMSHLFFLTTAGRCSTAEIFAILQDLAAFYELDLEIAPYDQRPSKPGVLKTLVELPGTMLHDGWDQLKARNKARP
ncbi:MAG TPA: hypothetical protein VH186_25735 [Chloroflexia bacterium]|nr:hypothetical protein [Chloroflexia bacterium]